MVVNKRKFTYSMVQADTRDGDIGWGQVSNHLWPCTA
jgi:hypothetical protein